MTNYTTHDRVKAFAIVNALIDAGFITILMFHGDHYHIQTTADETQFRVARVSTGIPSSNTDAIADMPDPNTVVIPDNIAELS